MTIFKIAIIFCFLFLSCQKKDNHQLNLEAEKQKIRKRTQAWLKAESNKNLDSALTFIAEDGVYLANDWPTLRGHAEISTFLEAAFAMPLDRISGGTQQVRHRPLNSIAPLRNQSIYSLFPIKCWG